MEAREKGWLILLQHFAFSSRAKCGWMETSSRYVLQQKQRHRAFPLIQDKNEML